MKQQDTLQEDLIQVYGLDIFGLSQEDMNRLPAASDDMAAVEDLRGTAPEAIEPLVPFLLVWFREMEAAISLPLRDVLLAYPHRVISEVETVLADAGDDRWSANLLEHMVMPLPTDIQLQLKDALEDLIEYSENPRNPDRRHLLGIAKTIQKTIS